MKSSFVGRWPITKMEQWDQDFGAVQVTLDWSADPTGKGWIFPSKDLTQAMKFLAASPVHVLHTECSYFPTAQAIHGEQKEDGSIAKILIASAPGGVDH